LEGLEGLEPISGISAPRERDQLFIPESGSKCSKGSELVPKNENRARIGKVDKDTENFGNAAENIRVVAGSVCEKKGLIGNVPVTCWPTRGGLPVGH